MLRETAMRRGTSTPRPITTHRGSRPDRSETKTNAALDRAPQCTDAERQQIFLTEIAVDVVPEEIPALERQRHPLHRSEEHTSELQSLMRISYAVFCLKKKTNTTTHLTR